MSNLLERLRRIWLQLPKLRRGIALVWAAAPRLTLLWILLLSIQGILPALQVLLTRPLVDGLSAAIEGDPSALRSSLLIAGAMAGLLLLAEILRGISSYVRAAKGELVRDHVSGLMHEQSMAIDLAFHDLPEYFDHLHRARREAGSRPLALLESSGMALQNLITLVAIARILAGYGIWLPFLLVLSTLPAGIAVLDANLRMHGWRRRSTEGERRAWYFQWLLTNRETAAEMRLYGLGAHFIEGFKQLRRRLRVERLAQARRQAVSELVAGGLALAVVGAALAWRLVSAMGGTASLGDIALFYAAFQQGQGLARGLLSNLGQILQSSLFLGDLFEFLDLEASVVDPDWDDEDQPGTPAAVTKAQRDGPRRARPPVIRFEGLRFAYPRAEQSVLDDFDLEIPAGRTLAILGSNGAGKSTLLKLLCRFYDPQAGRITFDGVDIRQIPLDELRAQLSVLFQTPIRFLATAAESIAYGDTDRAGRSEDIRAAVGQADAEAVIDHLPQGLDTPLGIGFGSGFDLSVGEWHRIALARACFRPAPILVLDEPTSAMDPWSELAWMEGLGQLAGDRTVLLITHRPSSARFADQIIVMEAGRIVESGDHSSLRKAGGRYARLWSDRDSG